MNLADEHLGVAQVKYRVCIILIHWFSFLCELQNFIFSQDDDLDEPFEVIWGYLRLHFIILLSGLLLGLCPDWQDWSGDGPTNAKKAMDMAEDYLGVPKVWHITVHISYRSKIIPMFSCRYTVSAELELICLKTSGCNG